MEITTGVHLLEITRGSYVYLVLADEPVLIDTSLPGRADAILKELKTLGFEPTDIAHILLTHYDVDHIGNAHALQQATGAKVWASQEDLPYILGRRNPPGIRRLLKLFYKVETPHIDETYTPGQKIAGIEVLSTPGHTLGHVSLLFGETLFSGDLVASNKGKLRLLPALATWDKAALHRSLRMVNNRSFVHICPAHGEPVQRGNLWDTLVISE